ncbi:holo-ACP synthase [Isobaculum melis]|uniref:Holo-[acyl-carrier-protein] synthase n=1 Tax=Isobaculum melis TaxID=142588 RepID=A0A1H9U281_9LACT|nr:holo-ACP synthase [Isobaculum melis]SES03382.1 holo-[acyl-carrier-protein] synthase [Isobaculum melis]
MIIGIGLDIVDLIRIEKAANKQPKFVARVLTAAEKERYDQLTGNRQIEFLAGRFAAKEAFAKAYGTGLGQVSFQDIEILNDAKGKPIVTKSPTDFQTFVSITHTGQVAAAQVILEKISE